MLKDNVLILTKGFILKFTKGIILNQYALFHFSITKNDRVFQFIVQPGTPWDDLDLALADFKEHFVQLRQETEKKEQEKQAEATVVEAELV